VNIIFEVKNVAGFSVFAKARRFKNQTRNLVSKDMIYLTGIEAKFF